jgi:hypothetical protein
MNKPRIEFIEYNGYCIETAPNGYWVTREVEGEHFIVATLQSIESAKEYINNLEE